MSSRPISRTGFESSSLPRETSLREPPARSSASERLIQLQNHLSPQGTSATSSLQVQYLASTSIPDELSTKVNDVSIAHLRQHVFHWMNQKVFAGWCSKEQAGLMMNLIIATKPKVCLETRVFGGASAYPTLMTLLYNQERGHPGILYAVDSWNSAQEIRNYDSKDANAQWWGNIPIGKIFAQFLDNIRQHNLAKLCVAYNEMSEKTASKIPPIDILHINENDSEQSSISDVETYLPKVREGGYIWFNDVLWDTRKAAFAILLKECDLVYRDPTSTIALLRKREIVVLPTPVPEPSIKKAPEEVKPTPAEKEAAKAPAEDLLPPAAEPPPPALQDPQSADVNREDGLPSTSVSPNSQMVSREELAPVAQNKGSVSTRNLLLVLGLVQGLISSVSKAPNLSSALTIVQNQVRSATKDLNLSPALAPFRSLLSSVDRHPNIAIIVALAAALAVFIYESIAEKKALESDLKEIQAIKDSIAKMETPIGDLKESIVAIIQAKSTDGQNTAGLTGAVESLDRTLAIVRSFKQPVENTTSAEIV